MLSKKSELCTRFFVMGKLPAAYTLAYDKKIRCLVPAFDGSDQS